MNQILFVDNKKNRSSIDIKKIIKFFAISIIIIGLIMVCEGSYSVYSYYKEKKERESIPKEQADIQLIQTEDNMVNISINSNIGISELLYSWNSDTVNTLSQDGKTSVFETIDIPVGENTLNIKVIDINGIETTTTQTFTIVEEKAVIELSLVGDEIKIIVTSKTDLSNVTYKWNSDNVNVIDMLTYQQRRIISIV